MKIKVKALCMYDAGHGEFPAGVVHEVEEEDLQPLLEAKLVVVHEQAKGAPQEKPFVPEAKGVERKPKKGQA